MNQDKLVKLSDKNKDIFKRACISHIYHQIKELNIPRKDFVTPARAIMSNIKNWIYRKEELYTLAWYNSSAYSMIEFAFTLYQATYSEKFYTLCLDAVGEYLIAKNISTNLGEILLTRKEEHRWQINLLDRLLRIQDTQTMLRWRFEEKDPLLQIREEMSNKRMPGELTKLQEMFMIEGEGEGEGNDEKMLIWNYISQHKRSWKRK